MADGESPRTTSSALRTTLWLAAFVLLAFALRSVFSIPVGFDEEAGRQYYTGNDPYYHWRTATHVSETGRNLDFDPSINYPEGRDNPNPPLWTWTSALLGVFLKEYTDVQDPIGTALNIMVAVWGALCVIPIYMVAKDLWGRRAGLWAAFFMAFSAPHIQRSIWGYADHDAVSMFFILLSFAFIVRALKAMDSREHVAHWNRLGAVGAGLRDAVRRNRDPLAYAALAGVAVTACAMTWKGYPYVFGIIAVAAFFQLVLDHLRNRDSTVTWMIYATVIAIGVLLPWALYYQFFPAQLYSTVNPSLYVLYGVVLLGLALVPTRDLPSILVFPALLAAAALGLVFVYFYQPAIWHSLTTGLGYFQQSKLYSTIAEAQRPQLGEVAATLGFFTFLLAFWGFFRTVRLGVKGDGPNILVASWAIVAIFMMFAAARFEVNAAPLFAVLLGYALDRIVAFMGTEEVRKRFRAQHGQNPFARSVRSLSLKTVTFSLLVALLLVVPNVWLGVDAAMPQEYKQKNVPGLADYSNDNRDPKTGNWLSPPRLGAFGLSFDDVAGSEKWSQAMADLARLDTCRSDPAKACPPGDADHQPQQDRPAFIAWWDYGHWAVALGAHPTVADPFQDHFDLSGRVLASDTEEEAMAWLAILLVRGDIIRHGGAFSPPLRAALERADADLLSLTGDYATDYRIVSGNVTGDAVFRLYDDVSAATGHAVGYLGVNQRMYPSGGGGIFYAPVFLADKNPDEYIETRLQANFPNSNTPKLLAVEQYEMVGGHSVRLDKVRYIDSQTKEQFIEYQGYLYPVGRTPLQGYDPQSGAPIEGRYQSSTPSSKFFGSLFARAFGSEILYGSKNAQGNDIGAAAGDGLLHWRAVIETSTATTLNDEASTPVHARGVVILSYFRGVTVNGTLRDDAGAPMPGYVVAFRDGHGATHGHTVTGADGNFSVRAPFSQDGDLRLEVFAPTLASARTLPASQALHSDNRTGLQFSWADARDGRSVAGVAVTVPRGSLAGRVFGDANGNGTYEAGADVPLDGAAVSLSGGHSATTGADGTYRIGDLPAGDYSVVAGKWPEYANSTAATVTVRGGAQADRDIGLNLRPVDVHATFVDASGAPVAGIPMDFVQGTAPPQRAATDAAGMANVTLAPGTWTIKVDYNRTAAGENGTAEVIARYAGTETIEVMRGEGEKFVTVRQQG